MEEHLMEVSRVKQAVWRPWEKERVVEASDLVVEKEEVAEHLRSKLETHEGTQYPTPWQCQVSVKSL